MIGAKLAALVVVSATAFPGTAQRREVSLDERRPIAALDSVWIGELTWMETRDAIRSGKTTAIVAAGSHEQNGPYVATAKHGYVLRATVEAVARKLGNALVAPLVLFEPGSPESPRFPGTLPVRMETYKALLSDIATALKNQGFENVVLIGDSGGNQRGLQEVAEELEAAWAGGTARIHYVPEYYESWQLSDQAVAKLAGKPEVSEGIHDDYSVNSIIMTVDPTMVRYDERVAAGKASINGISIEPKEKTIRNGQALVDIRAAATVEAIGQAITAHRP